jgi:hypothetical protein
MLKPTLGTGILTMLLELKSLQKQIARGPLHESRDRSFLEAANWQISRPQLMDLCFSHERALGTVRFQLLRWQRHYSPSLPHKPKVLSTPPNSPFMGVAFSLF